MNEYLKGYLAGQTMLLAFIGVKAGIEDPEQQAAYIASNPTGRLIADKFTVGVSNEFQQGVRDCLAQFNDFFKDLSPVL